MDSQKTSNSTINRMPEVQRSKVHEALLAGKSLRETAKIAGVSHVAVNIYKKQVFLPALREGEKLFALQQVSSINSVKAESPEDLTRSILKTSPFRSSLESLWNTTENAIDKAKSAVREIKDNQGNVVALADDLSALAPLLNQAHKNVALLGKATGELVEAPQIQVAVQVVMPAATAPEPVAPEPPTYTIQLQKPR